MNFNQIDVFLFLLIWYSNKSSGCPEDWEGFVHEGYVECFPCRKCPDGTTAVENCTKDHDTICDKCTGDEYYHILDMQCKTCTVCDAGYYVNSNCSTFNDTACDVCPTGTFSLVQNSSICKNCTDCRETKIIQACNRTADTVCEQTGQENEKLLIVFLFVGIIIISVVLIILLICYVRRRHRRNDGNGDPQEMQALQGTSSQGIGDKKQMEERFEPDKELSVNDKEQRIKSSVSTPGEMHVKNMKVKHVRDIKVRNESDVWMPCWISGICVLDQDKVVLCDHLNFSVKLVDTKIVSQIRFFSCPWDTALVPRDVTEESTTRDLIVTLPDANSLRYIRVTSDQIKDTNKVISVVGRCYGIQVTQDRKLAVSYGSYGYPRKVEILDMDGQVLRRLQTDHDGARLFDRPDYLAVSPGSGILYVSDWRNNTLTSISTRDWSVMTKLEGLDTPQGVTVDRAGSVFVCCWDGTVHLVAATGDRSTQILGKEDGLCWKPRAIGLSPEGDRMYVSGSGSDHVQEFQLTEN